MKCDCGTDCRVTMQNGLELRTRSLKASVFCTGCARLDQLLDGGLRTGELVEIAGQSATGKTQLCLTFCCSVVQSNAGRILYVDTTGSFSAYRLAEILLRRFPSFDQKILEQHLARVTVVRALTQKMLSEVLQAVEQNRHNVRDNLLLMIVDHVHLLLNPDLSSEITVGYHRMMTAGVRLRSIAINYNIAVVFINAAVDTAGDASLPVPAFGQWWSTIAHVRLLLTQAASNDRRSLAVLTKCTPRKAVYGSSIEFEIASEGTITPRADYSKQTQEPEARPPSPVF